MVASGGMGTRRRGVSLLETVIALFILLGVLTFTLELYARSLREQTKIERNERAAFFTDNVLSRLRHWARDPVHFDSDPWADFSNYSDPAFPGFSARVRTRWSATMTPCTAQESERPSARQRQLNKTLKTATIEIFFEGETLLEVSTLFNEPQRPLAADATVVVRRVSTTTGLLAADETLRHSAQLIDDNGRQIEDVAFSWSIQPLTGNAHISQQARDGSWGELTNAYPIPPSQRVYTGGECQAIASARYAGVEYRGLSEPVRLARP